jgi:hypothetical protein
MSTKRKKRLKQETIRSKKDGLQLKVKSEWDRDMEFIIDVCFIILTLD